MFATAGSTTGPPTTYSNATIDIELVALNLTSVAPIVVTLPSPGETFQVDSFFDVFTELSIGGNSFAVDSFFDITYQIEPRNSTADGRWDTEMVALSLTGQIPGGPTIRLRESPSLPSPGEIVVSDLPDGTFQVDSIFDVFTELSVDGGPFVPADGPTRLVLDAVVPEPASLTMLLTALGLLTLGRQRR